MGSTKELKVTLEDIFLKDGLFKKYSFKDFDFESLASVFMYLERGDYFNKVNTLDSYCLQCEQPTTFVAIEESTEKIMANFERVIWRPETPPEKSRQDVVNVLLKEGSFHREFCCPRHANNKLHNIKFSFSILEDGFVKTGQWPSIADLESESIKKYKKLDNEIYKELNTAMGLFSHGVGVGSFVYLRRILEKYVVHPAIDKMKSAGELTEDTEVIKRKRFKEKVDLSKKHLPAMLVSQPKVYGIVSAGIHELTEDECKKIFPLLRSAIEIILDQQLAQKEETRKQIEIQKELNKL